MHKPILFLLALFCSFATIYNTTIKRTKGFNTKKITTCHSRDKRWTIPDQDESIVTPILSQAFFYLGSGKQTYAFVSQDGTYVIKFFKQKHMSKNWWKSKETNQRRMKLREKAFTSYMLAAKYLKEETGLLYLHLTTTDHLKKKLQLRDQKGEPFTLNLDQTEFLIQKRANPTFASIDSLLNQNDINGAKESIRSIIDLMKKRFSIGLVDSDINCEKNLGLIGTRAIEIDIGEFAFKQPKKHYDIAEELKVATQDLYLKLESSNKELADYLLLEIQGYANDIP